MLKSILLFWMFFKIGLFSFGGGYAMLPMIYKEIEMLQLMDPREFSDLVALSQMTPGPIAVNAATYVGFKFFAETSIYNAELLGWEMFERPLEFISIPSVVIFAATIIASKKFKIGPITLTILAGIVGAFIL